jgi:hypothetical protein
MRTFVLALVVVMAGCSTSPIVRTVNPLEFQELLGGWWDEGLREEMRVFCGRDRILSRHVFSADGSSATWEFDRPMKIYDDSEIKSIKYQILGATSVSLWTALALEGEKRTDGKGEPLVWELVVVDDGLFRKPRAIHCRSTMEKPYEYRDRPLSCPHLL